MQVLQDGGYAICDQLDIPGEGSSVFTFARGWLLEVLDLTDGEYYFVSDGTAVHPQSRSFGVYYPRFTITRPCVNRVKGSVRGVGSLEQDPKLPDIPFIFETGFRGEFSAVAEAVKVLAESGARQSIEVNTRPSLISIKAKRLIDDNYLIFPSISRIAGRLSVSPEHLSRQFKRDFGISPSGYLHQLRVADATFRLSAGEEIIDISHEVGYNDLSRFYKQFRKQTRTSPAACRDTLAK